MKINYTLNNLVPNTGLTIDSGFFVGNFSQTSATINNFVNMGKDVIGYNPDQLVLNVQQVARGTTAGNIIASMNWVEFL